MRARVFPILLLLLLHPARALAKQVKLEWDPAEDAVKYELVVEKKGKPVVSTTVTGPRWIGELPYGFHAYRIRAIDAAGRPGDWSEPIPVIAMQEPPSPLEPSSGLSIDVYEGEEIRLRWKSLEAFDRYQVELTRGTESVFNGEVNNSELSLGSLASGTYLWHVKGVVIPDKDYPGLAGKTWYSKASTTVAFTLKRHPLVKPELISPVGETWPAGDGKMEFRWTKVEGARSYEISVVETGAKPRPGVKPAERLFRTEDSSIMIQIGMQGSFSWKVRALAGAKADRAPEASGEFSLRQSEIAETPKLDSSLAAGYSLFNLESTDQTRNFRGSATPLGPAFRVRGRRWSSESFGALVEARVHFCGVQGRATTLWSGGAFALWRHNFGAGWSTVVSGGPRLANAPFLTPTAGALGSDGSDLTVFGPGASVMFAHLLSKRILGFFEARFFLPTVRLSGNSGADLSGNQPLENYSLNLAAAYAMNAQWGYEIGISWDRTAIRQASTGQTSADQSAIVSGFTLLLSLTHRFGRD